MPAVTVVIADDYHRRLCPEVKTCHQRPVLPLFPEQNHMVPIEEHAIFPKAFATLGLDDDAPVRNFA